MRFIKGILLPAFLLAAAVLAKKPKIPSPKKFETKPTELFYFEDTETVILVEQEAGRVWRSTDAGIEWKQVKDLKEGDVYIIYKHPVDAKVAVALGNKKEHWITKDQGESWTSFTTQHHPSPFNPITFHADDSQRALIHTGEACGIQNCRTYYTTDGFKSLELLAEQRKVCLWAKSTKEFSTGSPEHDKDRVLCMFNGESFWDKGTRLSISDNFREWKQVTVGERPITSWINMAAVKKYILAAAVPPGSNELALFVTNDTNTWYRAEFGEHKIEQDAYTVLESTDYSIQIDVMTQKLDVFEDKSMGILFTSNSNGRYFRKNIDHTNRNSFGLVDFEKVTSIDGIVLVNVVQNWEEIEKGWVTEKRVQTQISFDDGRTFDNLTVDGDRLHLHSVTDQRNVGKVFSSPAPGILMGVGNTGDRLLGYTSGDLYVSDDAGLTWRRAQKEAHLYEFGDKGAVLVAIYDEGDTDKVLYSLNHGKDWDEVTLPDAEEGKVRATQLTTVPDSTSLKFILMGTRNRGSEYLVYSIDFKDMHERKCGEDDFESWPARVGKDKKSICVMGQKQSYRRRKADKICFVDEEFKDPKPEFVSCECEKKDYECDYNFIPHGDDENKECKPRGRLDPPPGSCKSPDDTFMGSSGWRRIPGNKCKGGVDMEKLTEWKCSETIKAPSSGDVTSTTTYFKGGGFKEHYYLEQPGELNKDGDETIVMLTKDNIAWVTHDHGKEWKELEIDEEVTTIYPHLHMHSQVYLITASKKVYYSLDRLKQGTLRSFDAPAPPTIDPNLSILGFHEKQGQWLLWTGSSNCQPGASDLDCHSIAYYSTHNGDKWEPLLKYVKKCQFMWKDPKSGRNMEGRPLDDHLVFCEQFEAENKRNPLQLLSSEDWFDHERVEFNDIVNFASMSEFIIVASKTDDHKYLKVNTSIDAHTFAPAHFPPKFNVPHQQAYTVLDSSTHAIFLHVTVNNNQGQEYGSIIKSNSNGTSYVLSISDVNRDERGFVDFEKMQGLEGVALINVVANARDVDKGAKKRLKSKITHNDGADWSLLTPPKKDSEGKAYPCAKENLEKCSLHLHGYTERLDPRNTYSSPSARGMMMGVGNVGEYLGNRDEGSTFITRDGGIVWEEVFKGRYKWEYGDQGSVIVIVEEGRETNQIFYTLDEGMKWNRYQFSDAKMTVYTISTVPSDTSLNFLIWGRETERQQIVTVNIDFSGLKEREKQCVLQDDESQDYQLWTPTHPSQSDDCLFGHVAKYYRKKLDAQCYNGRVIPAYGKKFRICACTRHDFECDYNYERQSDGSCILVKGLEKPDPKRICSLDPKAFEYWDITGYRKIPISDCKGGLELDLTGESHPCPGHAKEYQEKRGISGIGLFFAIVIPFAAAAGFGYYVWRNWDGKFGRIRLGDSSPSFDSGSPLVSWPIAAISGLVAVVAALPLLFGSLWRSVSSRLNFGGYGGRTYTTRSSFARGRGDYTAVDADDEGELLGEDSDEDV